MSMIESVAYVYGLNVTEVKRWPTGIVAIFYRNAQAHGWLVSA